jgi:peroxisomal 3,2-trans-enoyl-CoA isomerase
MKPMACIGTPRLVSVIGTHRFSTSINQQFDEAQKRLQTLKASPGNEAKLKLYGLFKQATVGKVNTKRPGMTDFVGKAKWDAWNSLNSLSQVDILSIGLILCLVYLPTCLFACRRRLKTNISNLLIV